MSLSRNLVAGMTSSIWTALVGLAVVPLYLKYLGIEAYGLVGFFATTQAVLSLLDLGLAPTMNREVARCSASGDMGAAGNLLHTLAVVYWIVAAFIALSILALGPFLSQHWLQSRHIPQGTISHAVMLMGLVAAARWPVGLYQGALIGAQRLAISSGINIAMTTLGSFGAVGILAFISPTIQALFLWQACVGLLYALTMRWAAWRVIGRNRVKFLPEELKRIWRFSAGVGGTAVAGLVLMQMDKILLSRMLSLADFGRYTLAGMLAGGLSVLISPAFSAIYPRFSAMASTESWGELSGLYRMGTRLMASFIFPIAFSIAFFAKDLIFVWTGNASIAQSAAPLTALLTLGTSINGIMHFPYSLQLACGMVRLPFAIAVSLMVLIVPLIIFLVLYHGVIGGAAAWLILNVVYLPFGAWLTHRHLLKGLGLKWVLQDVAIPFSLSALMIAAGENLASGHVSGHYVRLLFAGGLGTAAILACLALSPQLIGLVWPRKAP